MLELITDALRAAIGFFLGKAEAKPVVEEKDTPGILTRFSATSAGTALSRWQVIESSESPFVKIGRLYIENGVLIIRSDLDPRGFCLSLHDVTAVLEGDSCEVHFLADNKSAGLLGSRCQGGRSISRSVRSFTPCRWQMSSMCYIKEQEKRPYLQEER